jgi:hypothetical protein
MSTADVTGEALQPVHVGHFPEHDGVPLSSAIAPGDGSSP